MGWVAVEDQLPGLYAAIDDVECTVAPALGRIGRGHPPETAALDPASGSWSMDWWWHLPSVEGIPRVLVCGVEVAGGPVHPLASARVAVVRVAESGDHTIERELWRSSDYAVDCPAAAAVGIRGAAAELIEAVGRLELAPYLSS